MGKTFKQNFKRSKFEQERKVKNVICHPEHCKLPGHPRLNDIALVRVAKSFDIIPPRVINGINLILIQVVTKLDSQLVQNWFKTSSEQGWGKFFKKNLLKEYRFFSKDVF